MGTAHKNNNTSKECIHYPHVAESAWMGKFMQEYANGPKIDDLGAPTSLLIGQYIPPNKIIIIKMSILKVMESQSSLSGLKNVLSKQYQSKYAEYW